MIKFKFGKNKDKDVKSGKKKKSISILKKKDSIIGIPVLFTLSGFSPVRNAKIPDDVKKIAIQSVSSVKNVLFTKNIIKALKKKYPNASITFFTGERNFFAASNMDAVNSAVRLFQADISKSMKLVKAAGKFDLWIDFGVWSRFEAIMTQSAEASYKIGFRTNGEHRHFAYDKVVDYSYNQHINKNMINLVSILGINIDDTFDNERNPSIPVDDKLVVIDIFSDDSAEDVRRWSHNNWKSVVEFLNKLGYRIALLGAKKDIEESEIFNEVAGSGVDVDFFVGRLDFADTCKLISSSKLVIAGDNATLHLAAYLGVDVLGLFGPTSVEQYKPLGNNVYSLSSTACFGCQNIYGDESCYMAEPDCMDSITVEKVEEKLKEILGEVSGN